MIAAFPSLELTADRVALAVDAILSALGEPATDRQREALDAFTGKNYEKVRRLSSTALSDNFCKSLGYLGSAFKLLPNTDTILAEAARAAAEHRRDQTLVELSTAIDNALSH